MKITMTVDQLKALRARWRENDAGFIGFANLTWTAHTLRSPIGRLLDTTPIRFDRAHMRLTDAIYDAGGRDDIDAQTMLGIEPRAPQPSRGGSRGTLAADPRWTFLSPGQGATATRCPGRCHRLRARAGSSPGRDRQGTERWCGQGAAGVAPAKGIAGSRTQEDRGIDDEAPDALTVPQPDHQRHHERDDQPVDIIPAQKFSNGVARL